MINVWILLLFFVCHYIADYPLQTSVMATTKYKDGDVLVEHVMRHMCMVLVGMCILAFTGYVVELGEGIKFIVFYTMFHYLVDWYTSSLIHKLASQGRESEYWWTLGFDQLLHYSTLVLLVYMFL